MPTVPQVILELGLGAGALIPDQYAQFDDPVRGLYDTGQYAPDDIMLDASHYLNSFTCTRGTTRADGPLIVYEAGQATITLINQTGYFDPDNYTSPFTRDQGWSVPISAAATDGTFFVVSTANAAQIFVGDWVAFTAVAGGYKVTAIGAPSGGNVNVSITPTAPSNITSGTAIQQATMITPQVRVVISAVWAGVAYPLWTGNAIDWDPQYTGPEASYCVLTAEDGLGYLAQDGLLTELGSPVGYGEQSGARVNRILDAAAWPTGSQHRSVDAGDYPVQGTVMSGSALDELQATADAELGSVWVTASGQFRFTRRGAILDSARSQNSQGILGSGAAEMPYTDRDLEHYASRIVNTVKGGVVDGVVQTATDSASVSRYRARVFERTDLLLLTDPDALVWANLILYQNKDPEQWFSSVTIDPRANPAVLFPVVLGAEMTDRYTIRRRPPGMPMVERDAFVRGMTHEYSKGSWKTTWVLQSAARYNFCVYDEGVYDHDRFAF